MTHLHLISYFPHPCCLLGFPVESQIALLLHLQPCVTWTRTDYLINQLTVDFLRIQKWFQSDYWLQLLECEYFPESSSIMGKWRIVRVEANRRSFENHWSAIFTIMWSQNSNELQPQWKDHYSATFCWHRPAQFVHSKPEYSFIYDLSKVIWLTFWGNRLY